MTVSDWYETGLWPQELVEKGNAQTKNVPHRLKPRFKHCTYGTAEAVPLSKTEYFNKPLGPNSDTLRRTSPNGVRHADGQLCAKPLRAFGKAYPRFIAKA
jgi:hypothetical protein